MTAAEQMGIQEGDRIREVNGKQVSSTQEFISQIRSMNPGDQVLLSIERDREQLVVAGEVESRAEALARNQRSGTQSQFEDETWQTGYEEGGRFQQQQGRIARGGRQDSRIQQIEQQVNRISQQLDQLRSNLRQLRSESQRTQQYGRSSERQAEYDEYQSGSGNQEERIGTRQPGRDDQRNGQSEMREDRTDRFEGEWN